MPILTDKNLSSRALPTSTYGYSGTRIGDLGASEYTLVTVAVDVSGSVSSFRTELEHCISEIVKACLGAPRAHNLMLRVVSFDDQVTEIHGFRPLTAIQPDDYEGALSIGGLTALYDASVNAVEAMTDYGRDLTDHGFAANGLLFVLTDGADNASTLTAERVAAAMSRAVTGEVLESLLSILVGVNLSTGTGSQLLDFSTRAGFDHYLGLDGADAATFARIAAFVQKSVVAQSVMLGTGSASRLLTF